MYTMAVLSFNDFVQLPFFCDRVSEVWYKNVFIDFFLLKEDLATDTTMGKSKELSVDLKEQLQLPRSSAQKL